jgi:hypothetical protein
MSLFHGFGRFVKDMMSGGGDLNKHIVPGEIRKMAPKELQPGGFDPAKKWLGYDIKADPAHDAKIADRRETADALAAYNQGAPQFRGGQMGMSGPQQIQMPGQQGQIPQQGGLLGPGFHAVGPYGQQAQQLAGLQPMQAPGQPYGMPSQPQFFGAPNAGSTTGPTGMPYDNPNKSFRLVPGGYYK